MNKINFLKVLKKLKKCNPLLHLNLDKKKLLLITCLKSSIVHCAVLIYSQSDLN